MSLSWPSARNVATNRFLRGRQSPVSGFHSADWVRSVRTRPRSSHRAKSLILSMPPLIICSFGSSPREWNQQFNVWDLPGLGQTSPSIRRNDRDADDVLPITLSLVKYPAGVGFLSRRREHAKKNCQ